MKWTVVKSDYLKKSKNKEARLSWVRLLIKLGVKTGIAVQRISVSIPEVCLHINFAEIKTIRHYYIIDLHIHPGVLAWNVVVYNLTIHNTSQYYYIYCCVDVGSHVLATR